MKSLADCNKKIRVLFTDIDDTLTDDGQLSAQAYSALWQLSESGIDVIPVTGRPAGWCEMIARQWPVKGVIGENGALFFSYRQKKMFRVFSQEDSERIKNRARLDLLQKTILEKVPGSALASDQFCRLFDLAIDFCEDVTPLPNNEVKKILDLFHQAGAQAKVSSIHVNGWFGDHDKLTMTQRVLSQDYTTDVSWWKNNCAFVGDSPNDEPMFGFFPESFAVQNIEKFLPALKSKPGYMAHLPGGQGFALIAEQLLKNLK